MHQKPWYQSKTLWANVIMLALAVVSGEHGATGIPAQYLTYLVLALNVALRFLTNQAIGTGAR